MTGGTNMGDIAGNVGLAVNSARERETEKIIRAAIRSIPGIGSGRLRQIIAYFGSALAAWQAPREAWRHFGDPVSGEVFWRHRGKVDPEAVGEDLHRQEIGLVMPGEEAYPVLLGELADAPPLLYYRGHRWSGGEALAIVGSRRATAYGKSAANYIAREVAQRGVVIVSGLARGIDTAAHQGALAGDGVTWAFLGCGLDTVYPAENKRLAAQITERGALFSEFIPGTPPEPGNFPARNRLISGSSRGVVVVEAAQRSGALITVDFALEQGREVFAVPGPIFSELSRGPHNLLRMGAKIVEQVDDIWAEIGIWSSSKTAGEAAVGEVRGENAFTLPEAAGSATHGPILELLSDVPLHIDRIVLACPLEASAVALGLLELELEGKILQLPGQHYVLARQSS